MPSAQLCLTLCDPIDCSHPGSAVHGIFQARMMAWFKFSIRRKVDYHFLLQRIFLIQGSNLHLLHCKQTCYLLSHWGSPHKNI